MSSSRKRYAIVGLGSRSSMFWKALTGPYKESAELVGLCDVNQTRMAYVNRTLLDEGKLTKPVPTYQAEAFDQMVKETRPDVIIVTTIDRLHHRYIIRAAELGCDAISEKPMTTDAEKCQQILDTLARTGRKLRVTFNYRYSPARWKVRELIRDGVIGDVKQVHFEWLLDTRHGADYFRRWHRDKSNSGGLMVHKSTHHFDLVNWWLGARPEVVFGFGSLAFYGRENAEARGVHAPYYRTTGAPGGEKDPFALDLRKVPQMKALYLDAEHEDGYLRDRNVFSDGISIEDTMNLLVRYDTGAQMSYSLAAYCPWEGYRVMFTGTKGRIELQDVERPYVSGDGTESGESLQKGKNIIVYPHFAEAYCVTPAAAVGGHGGGDTPLLDSLFGPQENAVEDPLGLAANEVDGAWSILTGIAANRSFATGLPVFTRELVRFPQQ
ncbi:MAG: Gfo/Idh/MocA family oxidoreductase [Opitutales bacterium]|nr:Gfo/Idh/MocA family oxidoreductase [Opitutales bacterium]